MCRIVGYIGHRNAYDVLTQGLHRLEYRGYDSVGVVFVRNDGIMNVYKSTDKVNYVESGHGTRYHQRVGYRSYPLGDTR